MPPNVADNQKGSIEPPTRLRPFFDTKTPRLWYIGAPSILNGELLGIVAARKIEPDLASKTSALLRQLAILEGAFISGWHSPLSEADIDEAAAELWGITPKELEQIQKALKEA